MTAASDILVVAFLPLAALRALSGRGPARWLPAGALLLGLGAQLMVRLVADASRGLDPEWTRCASPVPSQPRLVPLTVLGERFTGDPRAEPGFLGAAIAAWLVALVVLVAAARTPRRDLLFPLVAAAHALILYLLPSMLAGVFTPRYAAAPAMLLIAATASASAGRRRAGSRR